MVSMDALTDKQARVLQFIQDFQCQGGAGPTYREIAGHFGFRSTKAAVDHVYALEKKGYVRCHRGRSRGIELLTPTAVSDNAFIEVPILGSIPAGCPADRIQQSLGRLSIDPTIIGSARNASLYALRVNGDSMEGRGIYEGDWVIVESNALPREGNIVAALIDGQNTLKTLAKQRGHFFLRAENVKYPDLVPIEAMEIQGVVKAFLRRVN